MVSHHIYISRHVIDEGEYIAILLQMFIIFLSKAFLKFEKCTKFSEIFLHIVKPKWIFIKRTLYIQNNGNKTALR